MSTLAFIVHAYRAALDKCIAWVETLARWVLVRTACSKHRVPSRGVPSAPFLDVARSEHDLNDAFEALHYITDMIDNGRSKQRVGDNHQSPA